MDSVVFHRLGGVFGIIHNDHVFGGDEDEVKETEDGDDNTKSQEEP